LALRLSEGLGLNTVRLACEVVDFIDVGPARHLGYASAKLARVNPRKYRKRTVLG